MLTSHPKHVLNIPKYAKPYQIELHASNSRISNWWLATVSYSKARSFNKTARLKLQLAFRVVGDPCRTRTCCPQFRKLMLYPDELRGRATKAYQLVFHLSIKVLTKNFNFCNLMFLRSFA